jgi:hypothetical protein
LAGFPRGCLGDQKKAVDQDAVAAECLEKESHGEDWTAMARLMLVIPRDPGCFAVSFDPRKCRWG